LISEKSSLKPLGQINRNFIGRKHLWKVLYKVSFHPDPLKNMAIQAILVSDWLISKNLL
jgi:hypothetical protein